MACQPANFFVLLKKGDQMHYATHTLSTHHNNISNIEKSLESTVITELSTLAK